MQKLLEVEFDSWDFNVFRLQDAASTAPFGPLALSGLAIFWRRGFIQEFSLDPIRVLYTFRKFALRFLS